MKETESFDFEYAFGGYYIVPLSKRLTVGCLGDEIDFEVARLKRDLDKVVVLIKAADRKRRQTPMSIEGPQAPKGPKGEK